jgi:hypothetical protein
MILIAKLDIGELKEEPFSMFSFVPMLTGKGIKPKR